MEELLAFKDRVCIRCHERLSFQQSMHGCVFRCNCKTINFSNAFDDYLESLSDPFTRHHNVPCITTQQKTTTLLKTINVELNFALNEVEIVFLNFADTHEIVNIIFGCSRAVADQLTRKSTTMFTCDGGLFEAVTQELSEAVEGKCVLNLPSPEFVRAFQCTEIPPSVDEDLNRSLPLILKSVLRQHQLEGILKVVSLGGRALVADEMGVGKTLLAIGALACMAAPFPCLVVCPSTVKYIWAEHVEKFLYERLRLDELLIIHSSNDVPKLERMEHKMVLVSYHMLVRIYPVLSTVPWRCIICDESHFLHTNPSGKDASYTEMVIALAKKTEFCLLLSGTPLSLSVFNLYNQVDILCPGILGKDRWHFALQFCHLKLDPYLHVGKCTRPTELLSFLSAKCMVRRLKKDVLDLPSKSRVLYPLDTQHKLSSFSRFRTEESFQKRYASSWRRKKDEIIKAIDYFRASCDQLVLFAHHIELLEFLSYELAKRQESFFVIKGGVPQIDRHKMLADFAAGETRIAVISIKACSVGVSLASCSCAVFCELPPDIALLKQAEDRLHRPGQERPVTIFYLVERDWPFDAEHLEKLQFNSREIESIAGSEPISYNYVQRIPGAPLRWNRQTAHRIVKDEYNGMTPNKTEGIAELAPSPAQKFMFTVSKNTQRIHVKVGEDLEASPSSGFSYWTFSVKEAYSAVQQKDLPFWEQLGHFLFNFNKTSSYKKRNLYGTWVPSNFAGQSSRIRDSGCSPTVEQHHGSRKRYRTHLLKLGYGFWWKLADQFGTRFYFASLRRDPEAKEFLPLCLACQSPLSQPKVRTAPGEVVCGNYDVSFFCDGDCRRNFYFRRSSTFIRQCVVGNDGGVCAKCGVDCEGLYSALIRSNTVEEREKVVEALHPDLTRYPHLYHRILTNPTQGSCWNADHIVPVFVGGGEAALENIQTLCVVCHFIKTQAEMKKRVNSGIQRQEQETSTVNAALEVMSVIGRKSKIVKKRLNCSTP